VEDEQNKASKKASNMKGKQDEPLKPEWKDFIALSIALLQTVLLPLIVIAVILGGIWLLLLLF